MTEAHEPPRVFWWWLMPVPIVVQLVAFQLDTDGQFFQTWIESESGFIENATALVLIPATVFAALIVVTAARQRRWIIGIWFFLTAAVCFSFAGEEVSWGQHWFGWESPSYFAENNRQGETNLHNLDIQLGRIVKSILTLLIIIGGLILPFFRDRFVGPGARFPTIADSILPTRICVPAALFVFAVRLVERFKTWFDLEWSIIDVNLKESQELYIALFLVLYAWSAYRRNCHHTTPAEPPRGP